MQTKISSQNKMKTKSPWKPKDFFSACLAGLQRIGKALVFPIAVLPIAALLNRLGAFIQEPYINANLIEQGLEGLVIFGKIVQFPGSVVFDNLPLIFAIGIGFGLAKDYRGEAALVAGITWLGMTALLGQGVIPEAFYGKILTSNDLMVDGVPRSQLLYFLAGKDDAGDPIVKYNLDTGVIGGILAGGVVAFLYNRYKDIQLPKALSFFGGRRFIPMLGVLSTLPLALFFAAIWPWCQYGLINIAQGLSSAQDEVRAVSAGGYGILNRLLQPFGLHHIINTFVWFQLPVTGVVAGSDEIITVNGDINAFQRGIVGSGLFTTGFFPLFLGGLPGAALAMIMTADKEKRKEMMFFFGGTGVVAFITGIDEPLIFAFIFVSPVLYVLNAILTGIFYMGVTWQQISIGFGFSAGLMDYAISFWLSWQIAETFEGIQEVLANPLWIFAYAAVMGVVYYFAFSFVIKKMKVPTPGRERQLGLKEVDYSRQKNKKGNNKYSVMAEKLLKIIGRENIKVISNCATRLRLEVNDNSAAKINDDDIKSAGGIGVVRLGSNGYQIIVGTDVEHVADAMLERWKQPEDQSLMASESNDTNVEKKIEIKPTTIFAPANGKVFKLDSLNDGAFSKKMLGNGLVINSTDGHVYAPVDGTIESVFDTKHAYGIKTTNDITILIHIGIDTINLKGKGFNSKIKQNQKIKKGDLLCTFDKDLFKKENFEPNVIITITPESVAQPKAFTKHSEVTKGMPLMIVK